MAETQHPAFRCVHVDDPAFEFRRGRGLGSLAIELDSGHLLLPGLLNEAECDELTALFDEPDHFRSTVEMEQYRYGRGTYRYFDYPLPALVEELRVGCYRSLSSVANEWYAWAGLVPRFPAELNEFLAQCHKAGQRKATPLILQYVEDGCNQLHQDSYGEIAFPLQVMCMLSEPDFDFEGGEFILETSYSRSTASTREVISPQKGDAVIFPNRWRPARSNFSNPRPTIKHGVAQVRGGRRSTLGLIFHDAR